MEDGRLLLRMRRNLVSPVGVAIGPEDRAPDPHVRAASEAEDVLQLRVDRARGRAGRCVVGAGGYRGVRQTEAWARLTPLLPKLGKDDGRALPLGDGARDWVFAERVAAVLNETALIGLDNAVGYPYARRN